MGTETLMWFLCSNYLVKIVFWLSFISSKIIITKQTYMVKGTYHHMLILLKYIQISTKNNHMTIIIPFLNKWLKFKLMLSPSSQHKFNVQALRHHFPHKIVQLINFSPPVSIYWSNKHLPLTKWLPLQFPGILGKVINFKTSYFRKF